MKSLLAVLLALALAVGAGVMTHNEPGYVLVSYAGWSLESTLAVLLGAAILGFLLFYLSIRLVVWTGAIPVRVRERSQQRHESRARRLLNRGLIELSEGHWLRAERLLAHPDVAPANPVLAGLLAALAAQEQHADERREYLRDAVESEPESETAISLVQAELQYNRRQFEQALANLRRLQEIAPRQNRVPRLLARVLNELGDWKGLAELMPDVRRRKLFTEETTEKLELAAWRGLLHANVDGDLEPLRKNWIALPRPAREHPVLVRDYCANLRVLGAFGEAETVLRGFLEKRWDDGLVVEYGLLQGLDASRLLEQAERWHRRHPQNPWMLLTLGRLSVRRQLWGKARGYFESALGVQPLAEIHLEFGRLLERLGEKDAAASQYRHGLTACLHVADETPAPVRREKDDAETDQPAGEASEPGPRSGALPAATAT